LRTQIVNCIVGIGININETDFPPDIPNPTSMRVQKRETFKINALVEKILDKIGMRYDQLISGDLESMHNEYNRKLYKKDITIQYQDSNGLFNARIKEIKTSGKLILRKEDNSEKGYLFGEVKMVQNGE
jgi:BirA family transcriptional regulator, biotin operon repressor / biotin---[acetyl-CoA-carboxylase] ligase